MIRTRILVFLSCLFATWTLFYLLGCFYSVSMNIAEWSENTRGFVGGMGGTVGLMISGAIAFITSKEDLER